MGGDCRVLAKRGSLLVAFCLDVAVSRRRQRGSVNDALPALLPYAIAGGGRRREGGELWRLWLGSSPVHPFSDYR